MISTVFGFTVFLFFVLFAVQVMVALYGRSAITAAGFDAARRVAQGTPTDEAEARARSQTGGRCRTHDCFDWSGSTPDEVVLVLDVPAGPSLVPPAVRRPMRLAGVHRTFRVRRERFRP